MTQQSKTSAYEIPCGQNEKESKIDIIITTVCEEETFPTTKFKRHFDMG